MNCSNCNSIIDTNSSGFVFCPNCGQVNMVNASQVHNIPLQQRAPSIYSKRVFETPPPKILKRHHGPDKKLIVMLSGLVGGFFILITLGLGFSNYQAGNNLNKAKSEISQFDFVEADQYLDKTSKLFALPSIKKQIRELQAQNDQWLKDFETLDEIEALVEDKDYTKASEKLKQISKDYPDKDRISSLYSKVQKIIDNHASHTEQIEIKKPDAKIGTTQTGSSSATTVPISPSCPVFTTVATRSTTDRKDDYDGYQVHLLYVLPSDRKDQAMDTSGQITNSVNSFQRWLCGQTAGKYVRMDTFGGGLDITFARLNSTDNTLMTGSELGWATNPKSNPYLLNDLDYRIKNLGFNNPKKIYLIYYDGTSNYSCGTGSWPPMVPGKIGAIYMYGKNPDWPAGIDCDSNKVGTSATEPAYFDYSVLHEIFHTLGFAPNCAPHASNSHTTDNSKDLMYTGSLPWEPSILDPGNDDYYNTNRSDCLDLAKSAFLVGGGSQLPPGF